MNENTQLTALYSCNQDGKIDGQSILIIRASGDSRLPLYTHLRQIGLRMIVAHPFIEPWAAPLVHHWIQTETSDVDVLETAVQDFLKAHPEIKLGGMVSFDEFGVGPCSRLAARMGLVQCPAPSEVVHLTNCKNAFREFCKEKGLPCPRFAVLECEADWVKVAQCGVRFPAVVKPSQGAGSCGVKMVYNEEELQQSIQNIYKFMETAPNLRHYEFEQKMKILVEELLEGPEVDCDVIVQNGRLLFASISDNRATQRPYFLEQGGVCPSALPLSTQSALVELVRKYCAEHGEAFNSVLHVEAICTSEGPCLVEVNQRVGGAETYTMVRTAYGVDLGEAAIRLALGLPVAEWLPTMVQKGLRGESVAPEVIGHAASINFQLEYAGDLISQNIPETVTKDPAFVRYKLYWSPGAKLRTPPQGFDYLGWMVVRGDDYESAMKEMNRLTKLAEFEIAEVKQEDTPTA